MSLQYQPRAMYGITRIDQPEKKNHGYYVRITHRGETQQKYFPDKSNGGKKRALILAKAYRNRLLEQLPPAKQEMSSRKRRKLPQSGVVGVTYVIAVNPDTGKVYFYWQAGWSDAEGKHYTAKYSIARYGEEALRLAKRSRTLKRRLKPTLHGRRSARS